MAKVASITKEDIFEAANKIASTGVMPTTAKLRNILRRGSETTLHKYLVEWKQRLLQNADRIGHKDLSYKKESITLRDNLANLQESLQNLTIELGNTEEREQSVIRENQELLQNKQALELDNIKLSEQVTRMYSVVDEIKNEREAAINLIIADKNQQILKLENELKELHSSYLDSLREQSSKSHDALMDEKVKIINLQHEVDRLKKELTEMQASVCMK